MARSSFPSTFQSFPLPKPKLWHALKWSFKIENKDNKKNFMNKVQRVVSSDFIYHFCRILNQKWVIIHPHTHTTHRPPLAMWYVSSHGMNFAALTFNAKCVQWVAVLEKQPIQSIIMYNRIQLHLWSFRLHPWQI